MIAHRGFLLRQGPLTRFPVGLAPPPQEDTASRAARSASPAFLMFRAAFLSRSRTAPHAEQIQRRLAS